MSMNRRVQRRAATRDEEERVNFPEIENSSRLSLDEKGMVDWTRLPDDTVIQIFSFLNYCDRASLSSTCRPWRFLGKSPYLWQELDLRHHKCDAATATSLASRCDNLQRLSFCSPESADAIINLRARNLREIRGDCCRKISDATLSVLVARHEALECLQIGPDFCSRISSDAVKAIANCCPQLKKLRLSGVHEVDANAINALAQHCQYLTDIGFIDCGKVDETALGNVASVRLLSVAGTTNIKWKLVLRQWSKLPQLTGLDVSRTDIYPNIISRLFSSSHSLKVLCALNCPELEEDTPFISNKNHKGKVLLAFFTDIIKGVASLFVDTRNSEKNVFLDRKKSKIKDGKLDELLNWLEWILSHLLLHFSGRTSRALDNFWLNQGKTLLLSFMQSAQEEVQERAARALATSVVIDLENDSIDTGRAEAVLRDGGTCLLLNLARSLPEVLQSEAVKAISALSVNANVAKAVAVQGGISILADLARSMNRVVVKAAARGLCNLSVGEEHKGAIVKAGGVKVLVGLISKWLSSPGGEGVLKCAAGALANLGADGQCSVEVVSGGGLPALVMLARSCKVIAVQEQATRALANLTAHVDSNTNNTAVGREAGALETIVELTRSHHDGVRHEAAGALRNLSFSGDENREAITAVGGVEALVALAHYCSNAPLSLQKRTAGAMWGLSMLEASSIDIGREGGVAPLIALAQSDTEAVHEPAAGALCNLAFSSGNALRIVEEGGVPALVHICSSSGSKMARFMSAMALAYMFDGRMDESLIGTSTESTFRRVSLSGARRMALNHIEAFVRSFSDPQAFPVDAVLSAPATLRQVTENARIQEASYVICSEAEIGRFVAMLENPSPTLKACAAFALLQFTIPGACYIRHHEILLRRFGATRVLHALAAASDVPHEVKIFACIVLENLEQFVTSLEA